jgi:hypothetical protein
VETYVSIDGHFLHTWAAANVTADILRYFEEATGVTLPAQMERKPALFGRRRFRGQLAAQEALF